MAFDWHWLMYIALDLIDSKESGVEEEWNGEECDLDDVCTPTMQTAQVRSCVLAAASAWHVSEPLLPIHDQLLDLRSPGGCRRGSCVVCWCGLRLSHWHVDHVNVVGVRLNKHWAGSKNANNALPMRSRSSVAPMMVDPWDVLCGVGKDVVKKRSLLNDRPGFRLSMTRLTVAMNLFVVAGNLWWLLLLLLDVKLWQASRGGIGDPEAGCAHEV